MSASCHQVHGEIARGVWVVPFGAKFGQFLFRMSLTLLPLRQRNGGGMAVDECAAYGDDRASGELLRVQACTVRFPMPLMCTPFEPGCLSRAIESIDDEDARRIARAEALYFTADPDGACCESEPYLTSSNLALRTSACFICAYANLSRGQISFAKACLDDLASMRQDCLASEDSTIRATYVVFAMAANVL